MATRTAFVPHATETEIEPYMPANYTCYAEAKSETDWGVVIVGADFAGWTLDGYVLPRLASGLHFGYETTGSSVAPVTERGE